MAKPIPEGLHSLTIQLNVDGAAEAMEFYKKAFGAEERARAMDPTGKKVWHGEMRIGDTSFYINDTMPEMGGKPNPSIIWLYLNGVDAAFKRAVDAGGKVSMALQDMFWGDRTGSITDRWGNQWNIAQRMRDLDPAQMQEAQDEFVAQQAKKKK